MTIEALLAVTVGVLFGAGVYLLLRRTVVRLLIGLALVGNAANLLIFVAASLRRGVPPIASVGETAPPASAADPLAQALILTAIVISFGVLGFALALTDKTVQSAGSTDLDDLVEEDSS
ncbi:MAG: NADH-quinone oxidoreductase subunit K [Fimbriimonadales bacterium]|nr:NADH-quinone oxidoreductase subunit K [Fimbriimonadales bacterium]